MEIINQGHAAAAPKQSVAVPNQDIAVPEKESSVPNQEVTVPIAKAETAEIPSRRRRRSKAEESDAVQEETASADTSADTAGKDAVVEFGINSDEEDRTQEAQAETEEPVKTPRRRRIR